MRFAVMRHCLVRGVSSVAEAVRLILGEMEAAVSPMAKHVSDTYRQVRECRRTYFDGGVRRESCCDASRRVRQSWSHG